MGHARRHDRAGDPKVRPGTYFPSLLQPRRRAEHALLAVVQEAYAADRDRAERRDAAAVPRAFHAQSPRDGARRAREAIAAVVRTIFAQPDHATAMTKLRKVTDGLRGRVAQAAALLEVAAEDILAYRHLPLEHQRQSHSTKPLERLNKEIRRRSNVVGIFPSAQSIIRLVGAILLEQDNEWAVAERRDFSAESMKQLTAPTLPATAQEIFAAIA